jgi:adenylate cyclase
MLRIRVTNRKQVQEFDLQTGPLEFGRGPERDVRRIQIADASISRDQLRLEELPSGRVRVENLSKTNPIKFSWGEALPTGAQRELDLPLCLAVQHVRIELELGVESDYQPESLRTIAQQPAHLQRGRGLPAPLTELGDAPPPEMLIQWLETLLALHGTAAGSTELFTQTARAVVELIGLDMGMVLLRKDESWIVAARHAARPDCPTGYSRTLIQHVIEQRRTVYQDLEALGSAAISMQAIDVAVVSPIFGVVDEVIGLVYGMRQRGAWRGQIRPIEAQMVQLVAAAVGSHLNRAAALRTRIQFEQFFSPELVRELERNPDLLEGRDQEVTLLVSDLRGYTSLSQRLGAQTTFRLVRDMMERFTECIVEQGGAIVDYAGDGILAMWNAPVPQKSHAARACRAALAMLNELPELNAAWQPMIGKPLVLGIGINSGMAQVGNTGSTRKLKYGPHGHTVNLTSRVQDATKKLAVPALLTAATRQRLPAGFLTRALGAVDLAGVTEPVEVYELQGEEATTGEF